MFGRFSNIAEIERLLWARPIPVAAMLGAFVVVVALTMFRYRHRQGLPAWSRVALAVSRAAALCLIVAILIEPVVSVKRQRTTKGRLLVLIDKSESMSVTDRRVRAGDLVEAAVAMDIIPWSEAADANSASMALDTRQRQALASASRLELARTLVSRSARPVFDSIAADLDVSYYAFGKTVEMLDYDGSDAASSLAALRAAGDGTFIAESLEAATNANRDAPLAGIVLLTDGLDTSSRGVEAAVDDLAARGIPVFPVPIGIATPDDVSIRNMIVQDVAFSGDKVPVRVQIRSKGYEKRRADLTVRLNDREVARRGITLRGGLQFEDIFFNVDVHEKGAAQVEIAIAQFADEATAENNRVQRSVRVVNEKINVLCLEGSARWEYRYLRAMLKRDPRINATFIATRARPEMARNSSEYIARFPETREEAFQYDLVILGDVDAKFFSAEAMSRLEELVSERGGSLLMLCGSRFAPTSYGGTPVERMLPVRFGAGEPWQDVDDSVYPVLTAEGKSSLVMTLEMDPEINDGVWSRVAPLDRLPPLGPARPGATVLVELSESSFGDRYPLVSWQRYGTGKCMLMGTDRLWLLRFKTGDKYHWRVWSQCIQFLTLSRLIGEHKRIRLETDRATYPIGEKVLLYAHVLDDRFEPVIQSGFDIVVSAVDDPGAAARRVTLQPDREVPGLYEGYFSPTGEGRYRMETNAADRSLSNTTEFQVADIKPEMANTDMQIERLRRIADLSGGECLPISRLRELPSLLGRRPGSTRVSADLPLWDNGLVVFLLVCLLGFEWIMRRRYDLS